MRNSVCKSKQTGSPLTRQGSTRRQNNSKEDEETKCELTEVPAHMPLMKLHGNVTDPGRYQEGNPGHSPG